ncbi:hypothetical protein Taro_052636 [Colocasia esculenta]|uniref:Uncharacterized protein n=1 Tax=Colocasia esculenta TaxID=4460 RepID=A0A843XIY7_COLES|nr:hypothetical protein [Colocasia esculenta]
MDFEEFCKETEKVTTETSLPRMRQAHGRYKIQQAIVLSSLPKIEGNVDDVAITESETVRWTPYVREDDATQPWVERGRPYFGRDIWLHCFNTVVPLHHRLVARTLGLHQAVVTDWTVRVREQLDDWEQRGKEVVSEATSDEDYFRAYARRYGAQVYKGTRRPLDLEGRISSLEGILHSTIQQRDDLQAVVDQLVKLDRAQQMVGGASSSREDPGRSVLEGQLASAEQELRTALARMTTLETEMAELRLHPEAAEVAWWCQEAEAAAR